MRIALWLLLCGLLTLAGCARSGAASDQDKQNGLYGGVTGGWTHQ